MDYAQIIGTELFNAGWGLETGERDGLYVVKAWREGQTCVASGPTWQTAFVEVQRLCGACGADSESETA